MLLWPNLHPPTLGAVWFEDEAGDRRHHIFASVHEEMRVKDYVEATINGTVSTRHYPTEAQQLLAAFRLATNAQAAMMIWADPHRTWPRLYRILEELEVELEMHVDKAGLCSKDERSRFTNSANSAEVAGKDSRHRGGKFDPPKRPMSLHEAVSFIGGLIQGTMRLIHSAAQTR